MPVTCEDRDHTGPARNRHRGIEAANDAEVIIIIDPHMRFRGDVLRKLALHVKESGGLATTLCHHNEDCSFTAKNGSVYAGARIVYRAKNGTERVPLCGKWSRETTPGPRGCVMGACYDFRRDWYYDVGQPLAALPGWGCDEEALSIAAWCSGTTPEVLDGHVAHRWRARPPWNISSAEAADVFHSRCSLVQAVVSEVGARRELLAWAAAQNNAPIPPMSPETDRFRMAMLRQPRSWLEWRAAVCESDEIDGVQEKKPAVAVNRPIIRAPQVSNPAVTRHGITCPHCHEVFDTLDSASVTNTYPNGNRRHICPMCKNPFVSVFRQLAEK